MAAAAESAEGFLASKSGRALAFACSFAVCLLAAGALAITILGRPHGPSFSLELTEAGAARPKPAPVAALALSEDGAAVPAVTQPVHAGSALFADPALIE